MITQQKCKTFFIVWLILLSACSPPKKQIQFNNNNKSAAVINQGAFNSLFFDIEKEYALKNYDAATSSLNKLQALGVSNLAYTYYKKAQIQQESKQNSAALVYIDSAIYYCDTIPSFFVLKATLLSQSGNSLAAANQFFKSALIKSNSYTLFKDAAVLSIKAKEFELLNIISDSWISRFGLTQQIADYKLSALSIINKNQYKELLKIVVLKYPYNQEYKEALLKLYIEQNDLINLTSFFSSNAIIFSNSIPLLSKTISLLEKNNQQIDVNNAISSILNSPSVSNSAKGTIVSNIIQFNGCKSFLKENKLNFNHISVLDSLLALSPIDNLDTPIQVKYNVVSQNKNKVDNWLLLLQFCYFKDKKMLTTYANEFNNLFPLLNSSIFYKSLSENNKTKPVFLTKDLYSVVYESVLINFKKATNSQLVEIDKLTNSNTDPVIFELLAQLAQNLNNKEWHEKYKTQSQQLFNTLDK